MVPGWDPHCPRFSAEVASSPTSQPELPGRCRAQPIDPPAPAPPRLAAIRGATRSPAHGRPVARVSADQVPDRRMLIGPLLGDGQVRVRDQQPLARSRPRSTRSSSSRWSPWCMIGMLATLIGNITFDRVADLLRRCSPTRPASSRATGSGCPASRSARSRGCKLVAAGGARWPASSSPSRRSVPVYADGRARSCATRTSSASAT